MICNLGSFPLSSENQSVYYCTFTICCSNPLTAVAEQLSAMTHGPIPALKNCWTATLFSRLSSVNTLPLIGN